MDEEKGEKRRESENTGERDDRERETRSDGKKSSAFKKGKRIDERNKKVPVD